MSNLHDDQWRREAEHKAAVEKFTRELIQAVKDLTTEEAKDPPCDYCLNRLKTTIREKQENIIFLATTRR